MVMRCLLICKLMAAYKKGWWFWKRVRYVDYATKSYISTWVDVERLPLIDKAGGQLGPYKVIAVLKFKDKLGTE